MTQYYFLGTRLPTLRIGEKPEITFEELNTLLKDNLTQSDYRKCRILRGYYDILNIRAFWLKEEFDPHGTMSLPELEENLLTHTDLPNYIVEFLEQYTKKEDRIKHFPELIGSYFRKERPDLKGFLKNYFEMEREIRLILVGYRAKKLGRDLVKEFQFEDPNDPIVNQILIQKDSKTFEAPFNYEELKSIFEKYQDEPLKLHMALTEYRFNRIEEMLGFDVFSIDRILGYIVQLIMVENWQQMNKEKGLQIIDTIVKEST